MANSAEWRSGHTWSEFGVRGGPLPPSAETLRDLQRAHLLHVPFESYDCALGRPVTVDPAHNFSKIVEHGGAASASSSTACSAWLLEALGFEVTLLSARPYVVGRESEAEPEFSDLVLLVPAAESAGWWTSASGMAS